MDLTHLARLAGLIGGLCWLLRLLLDLAGHGTGGLADLLYWVGLLLVAVALAGMGAALVSTSATWLRVVAGAGCLLLVWSVLEVLHDAGDPRAVDGLAGLLVAVASGRALSRDRQKKEPPRRRASGAHAR
jgi:polyferredoxin